MTTLYRAFDAAGGLLYLGVTENLKKRQGQHRRSSEWFPEAVRWTDEAHPDRKAALAAERAAIEAENPLHNSDHADHSICRHARCVQERELESRMIEVAAAAAPPLTVDQIDRLRKLFAPTIAKRSTEVKVA